MPRRPKIVEQVTGISRRQVIRVPNLRQYAVKTFVETLLLPMPVPPKRVESLKAEIAARLRGVCENWPPEMFDEMVQRVAEVTAKYEGIPLPSVYDRRDTDRIVEDLRDALERDENTPGPTDDTSRD